MQLAKKLRHYLWLLKGIWERYHKIIVITFILGLIVFVIAVKSLPFISANKKSRSQVVAIVGLYTPTDLPLEVQRLISSGLTDVTETGKVLPALASSWDVSEDGKKYTFHIRDNIFWHDKKKFVASDINYNLRDVELVPVNDTTLVVKLKEPYTPLPNFLSKPLFRKGLIGIGSYKIAAIRLKGENVTYLKLTGIVPNLAPIEIKFFPTDAHAKTAFKLGEVDTVSDVIDPSPFNEWKNFTVIEDPKFNQYVAVFFDTTNDKLKDKDFRQALAFAIEKPEKNRISSPISSKSWAYTTRVKLYEKDIDEARRLIGTIDANNPPKVTLATFPQFSSLAERIAAAWDEIGVKTTIKLENGVPSEYQALLVTQEIPFDPDQYTFWHSTQSQTNRSRYANPKIDKLLEDGRKEADLEKRKKIYFDFQRYLVDDAPAVFLFHPTTYTISRK